MSMLILQSIMVLFTALYIPQIGHVVLYWTVCLFESLINKQSRPKPLIKSFARNRE
jgi:hypothetical protein